MKLIYLATSAALAVCTTAAAQRDMLHYDYPAQYFEQSLLIGNGSQGAAIYGDPADELLELNDITLWTGEAGNKTHNTTAASHIPEIRSLLANEKYAEANDMQRLWQGHYSEAYMPLGNLRFSSDFNPAQAPDSYYRQLNLNDATAQVTFKANGGRYERTYFASAPDSVIVMRFRAIDGAKINGKFAFDSQLPHHVNTGETVMTMDGYAAYHSLPGYCQPTQQHYWYDENRGVHFRAMLQLIPADGTVQNDGIQGLMVKDCTDLTIIMAMATSFNGFDKDPVKEGRPYKEIAASRLEKAKCLAWEKLMANHVADYQELFNRVQIDLGNTDDAVKRLNTDEQLRRYTDLRENNPELEALYMQYGRYLLIASSRTKEVPANLQGLWNRHLSPPWSCNYTVNINLEENYWAAETANLSELHLPLLTFMKNLQFNGEKAAKMYCGVDKGWITAQNTDIWAMACPVGMQTGDPSWANWVMGSLWLATHIWEHYEFTQDKDFLKEYYPVLKGAVDFAQGWMVEHNGKLVTSPATSPENVFLLPDGTRAATCYGGAADLAMIRECMDDCRQTALLLGKTDDAKVMQNTLARLSSYKIGKEGNLQEWYHDWKDADPQHRHQSHLFGLYPGHHISPAATPELAKACARTLQIKGDNTTGWSTGWRVNLYARLLDGEGAYRLYRRLLQYVSPDEYKGNDARRGGGTYPNLLDAHAPFQIDGNFGGCAGVIEMLVQSTDKGITLLPALPEAWKKEGSVKGIKARGGFILDFSWNKKGKIIYCSISSDKGGTTTIYYNGKHKKVTLKKNQKIGIVTPFR